MIYAVKNPQETGDLYRFLPGKFIADPQQAIAAAVPGEAVFFTAPFYPAAAGAPSLSRELLVEAEKKGLKLYVEYPSCAGELSFEAPSCEEYARGVVSSDFFGADLPEHSIVVLHGCWSRKCSAQVTPFLVSARVAGYLKAVYGIPEKRTPLLFTHPEFSNVLIATSGFSRFREGRYAPKRAWKLIWEKIFAFLGLDTILPDWESVVADSYTKEACLPADAREEAFRRNLKWFSNHMLARNCNALLIREGFSAEISSDGSQLCRTTARGDCTGEGSLIFACGWDDRQDPKCKEVWHDTLDVLFHSPLLCAVDPADPCYGCLKFYENVPGYYGDDNCRAAMGAMLGAELTGETCFDVEIMRCLYSILRTTGTLGFRPSRLDVPKHFKEGKTWMDYHEAPTEHYRPHSQGWMFAGFLAAWYWTGYDEFRTKAELGIRNLMAKFPDEIIWTNGISQEYARMLLPLAMLVRISDTPENRAMLEKVWEHFSPLLEENGAVRELVGLRERGMYPAPDSNEKYGTTEAPLIQENGDNCCDLLYTLNFAYPGLCEAAVLDKKYQEAADRVENFLLRIQTRSAEHPELDGVWLRGYDWELGEYWGSSADTGWGAWCIESGWTNSIIASTMYLRSKGRSWLDVLTPLRGKEALTKVLPEMSTVTTAGTLPAAGAAVAVPGAEQ